MWPEASQLQHLLIPITAYIHKQYWASFFFPHQRLANMLRGDQDGADYVWCIWWEIGYSQTQLSVVPRSVSVFWSHPLSFFLQAANDKL